MIKYVIIFIVACRNGEIDTRNFSALGLRCLELALKANKLKQMQKIRKLPRHIGWLSNFSSVFLDVIVYMIIRPMAYSLKKSVRSRSLRVPVLSVYVIDTGF